MIEYRGPFCAVCGQPAASGEAVGLCLLHENLRQYLEIKEQNRHHVEFLQYLKEHGTELTDAEQRFLAEYA